MWPYKTRGSRFLGDIEETLPTQLSTANFSLNDSSIKHWLPDKLLAAIDVLCDVHDSSRPDILRALLFGHAFGQVELAHLIRRASACAEEVDPGLRWSSRRAPAHDFSRREINARYLGKSTADVKLLLPGALKTELEHLAGQAEKQLSDYLRGVLARLLLGERLYQEWQQALAQADAAARIHESEGYSMSVSFTVTSEGRYEGA